MFERIEGVDADRVVETRQQEIVDHGIEIGALDRILELNSRGRPCPSPDRAFGRRHRVRLTVFHSWPGHSVERRFKFKSKRWFPRRRMHLRLIVAKG